MIGFLRFVGVFNAAVWFGAAVFATAGAEPAVYSQQVQDLLQKSFPYLSGLIAHALRQRFFYLSLVCAGVALVHLTAEWLYQGRPVRKFSVRLLAGLVALVLVSGGWLQPRLARDHKAAILAPTPAERQTAKRSHVAWHVVSRGTDILLLGGLAAYLWRMVNPPETFRFVSASKFRS